MSYDYINDDTNNNYRYNHNIFSRSQCGSSSTKYVKYVQYVMMLNSSDNFSLFKKGEVGSMFI